MPSGPGPRGTLRVAVGALIGAATTVATVTWDIPAEVVAAWSGLALAVWGAGEAIYDSWASRRTSQG